MTPTEVADQLVTKYRRLLPNNLVTWLEVKCCATIAADELIRIAPWGGEGDHEIEDGSKQFYMKVKHAIEKL